MFTRRAFMAAPLLGPLMNDSVHAEAALSLSAGVFRCPRRRARVVAVLRMRETVVTAIAFGNDFASDLQDMVAFAGPTGRLLALERLTWTEATGGTPSSASLATRPAMMADRVHIALARSAAARLGGSWRRENWTDYLRLDRDGLHDAPPRPVAPETWQQGLSRERADIASSLPVDTRSPPPAILAALRHAPIAAT